MNVGPKQYMSVFKLKNPLKRSVATDFAPQPSGRPSRASGSAPVANPPTVYTGLNQAEVFDRICSFSEPFNGDCHKMNVKRLPSFWTKLVECIALASSHGFVHADLKGANTLFKYNFAGNDVDRIVYTDFDPYFCMVLDMSNEKFNNDEFKMCLTVVMLMCFITDMRCGTTEHMLSTAELQTHVVRALEALATVTGVDRDQVQLDALLNLCGTPLLYAQAGASASGGSRKRSIGALSQEWHLKQIEQIAKGLNNHIGNYMLLGKTRKQKNIDHVAEPHKQYQRCLDKEKLEPLARGRTEMGGAYERLVRFALLGQDLPRA